MKLWEFKKLTTLPNFFLFYGDEFFLEFYFKKINKIIEGSETIKFYYDEFNFEVAKNHLGQNSLFGDKNSLIIKTDKWIDVSKLVEIVGDNYFYYFYYGDVKKVKTKQFKNNFVRFFQPDLRDLILISNQYLKEKGKSLDVEILKHLINRIDYRFLFSELDKIILLENPTIHTIDKIIFHYNETSFDEIFDLVFLKQDYLEKLQYLLFQGVDEIAIITSFSRYVKILYLFNLYIKNIGFENVSKEVLGYQIPKNLEDKRKKIAVKIKENQFLELFENLLKAELELKSTKDKESILFKTFIIIKNLI